MVSTSSLRSFPQGTHRYNATHTGETTSGMGGSRNSKTTDRLSGDTVGSQCRPRHRESVPHITLLKSRLPYRKVFLLSHRTVPNEAGDHRAASEPPLGRGRFVCNLPTCHPHKYNGLYGPGFISAMTPGDPLPPPSRHIEPPFSVGAVREVVEKPSTLGRIFQCVSRPAPGWGGVAP